MFLRSCAIVFLLIAALALPSKAAEDYSLWAHSAKIHFNTTATGANVAGPLKDFPVLIRLDAKSAIFVQSLAAGYDLRFADADGTHLDYQVERWDALQGKAEIWVRVPQVDGNSDKDYITAYWGRSGADIVSDGAKVFPSQNGFMGVWHLGEGGAQTRSNSVGGGNHGTAANYDGDERVEGVVGMADSLDGGTPGDYLDLGSGFADFSGGFTFSVWVCTNGMGLWEHFLDLGNGTSTDNLLFGRRDSSNIIYVQTYTGTLVTGGLTINHGIDEGVWTQLTITASGQDLAFYKNGLRFQSGKLGQALGKVARTRNYLGKSNWEGDAYFKGKMDEPEISQVARSDDWIKLAFENQKPDSRLLAIDKPVEAALAIIAQPQSITAADGQAAAFTVTANSGHAIAYQWFKGGKPIANATGAAYNISAVSASDTGTYVCRLIDGVDTLVTAPAVLSLAENYTLWTYSMKINFNTTASGANVAGNVAGFPMLIRLNASNFDFSKAADSGRDVRFSDAAGVPLSFQLENWDPTGKKAEIWVRVPEVKGNTDAHAVTMYWGRPGAASASNSSAAFRGEDGFRGVWHLEESGGGDALDAVSKQFNGAGVRTSGGAAGIIGGAFHFDGTVAGAEVGSSYVGLPAGMTSGLKAFTFSLWAKEAVTGAGVSYATSPTLLGMTTDGISSGDFGLVSESGLLSYWHGFKSTGDLGATTDVNLHDGQWHHIAATYSGSVVSLYEAGTKLKELAADNLPLANLAFTLGASFASDGTHAHGFNGYLDDLQISGLTRSADWIKLAYESQREGGKAVAFTTSKYSPLPIPVADPPAGTFKQAIAVTLTCPVDGARIYYTLDGSAPDTLKAGTLLYKSALPLAKSAVINAEAFLAAESSPILTATYNVAPAAASKGDTLQAGRTINLDAGHWLRYPLQESKAPILVTSGILWSPPPDGFDSVGARFRVTATDSVAAFPGLQVVELDTGSGLSLYRLEGDGSIKWLPPKDGLLWVPESGTYFWALDTAAPRIRYAGASPVGRDSLRLSFSLRDNVMNLRCRMQVWSTGMDTLDWVRGNAGDTVGFTVAAPASAKLPLEVRLTVSDNVRPGIFPGAGRRYTVGRSLPAFNAQLALDPGVVWKLAGIPLAPSGPMTVSGLGGTPGALLGAVWDKEAGDSGASGAYRILRSADTLPRGRGFWLASEAGIKSLSVPAALSAASDSDGFFPIMLVNGWNLVTCPSIRPLPWPASRKDGGAYLNSKFKGLRSWDGSDYRLADTLRPWEGYYVYNHGADTVIRVGLGAPGVPKPAAKASAGESGGSGPSGILSLTLGSGSGLPLEMGAASFAGMGIGREDEPLPPSRGGAGAWLERAGRSLATDYIPASGGKALGWSLVAQGKLAGYRMEEIASALPQGFQAWAVSPARRMKYRLDGGGGFPVTGTDTLAIYVGSAAQLAALPDWNLSRESPPDLRQSLRSLGGGLELILSLPAPARVEVRIWSPQGRRLAHLDAGKVGEGRHVWDWSALSGRGAMGPGNRPPAGIFLVEISVQGDGWRFHRTETCGPIR